MRSNIPQPTAHISPPTSHLPLLLILLLFTLITLYNSARLPLGEAADETDHYQYIRFVARTGHPPLTEAERNEAGFKGGLAPLYYWLTAWPVALVGEDTEPDIRRVDSRPERHIPTDGLGINHVMHTLDEQWPWRGQALAWHLVRLLSLPMAWVTIIATYALVRRLVPEAKIIAIGAAIFVALLPRFVISSAVINDDNLVFALTALLLLIQIIILQGNHRPRTFALFGALFGLALITKYFSLILIPEILFTLFVYKVASSRVAGSRVASSKVASSKSLSAPRSSLLAPRSSLLPAPRSPLLSFLVALTLIAGPWFIFIFLRFNRIDELGLIPGLAAALGEPQVTEGLVGLLSGQPIRPPAATYSLLEWFSLLYRSFWFEYGWMQIFAPTWIYGLFTAFLLIALVGLIHRAGQRIPSQSQVNGATNNQEDTPPSVTPRTTPPQARKRHAPRLKLPLSPIPWLLGLHLALFLIVLLARYILSATIDTGQGRHLYPALPVIALLISLGLNHFGFTIYDLRSQKKLLLPATCYLLLATCYLLPATPTLQPANFIWSHYHILPISIKPPSNWPITYRQSMEFADGLSLAGFDVAQTVSAGEVLPVTLYWRAEKEAKRDYLVSLCLQDETERPVACWQGHFADGRYPARAWEAGDTLVDTIFIPIPACYHIPDKRYQLHLELWSLALDSPTPRPEAPPVLVQTFTEPAISIQATGPALKNLAQTVEVWRAGQPLTGPTNISSWESLSQITYTPAQAQPEPAFEAIEQPKIWLPLAQRKIPLFLPCDDSPKPFAYLSTFIADPTLPPSHYRSNAPEALPNLVLSLSPRLRTLAPIQSNLTFASRLAPPSLQLADQPPLNLIHPSESISPSPEDSQPPTPNPHPPTPYSLLPTPYAPLPITIRWQTHRWLADPLIVSLKLLDKDFKIGGERIASLGDRYPNVLWVPTEIVEETYPLQLKPDAPPGLYQLELSLIHQDKNLPAGFEYLPLTNGQTTLGSNLYPATVRLLDPAHNSPPTHPFSAQLGEAIHLTGYDLNPESQISNPESPILLALYWQSSAKIATDYTVFTQLLGPDGQVWAQWDNPPQAGRYPTTAWTENDAVVDRYTLTLRQGAPPGDYRLLVGMYDPATGQRLPVTINGQPQPAQAIELTTLSLVP